MSETDWRPAWMLGLGLTLAGCVLDSPGDAGFVFMVENRCGEEVSVRESDGPNTANDFLPLLPGESVRLASGGRDQVPEDFLFEVRRPDGSDAVRFRATREQVVLERNRCPG